MSLLLILVKLSIKCCMPIYTRNCLTIWSTWVHIVVASGFLTDRSQYVILGNMKSYATPVLSGVPQGTVLALLLFLMYINGLPTCVQNKVRLYADDVLI